MSNARSKLKIGAVVALSVAGGLTAQAAGETGQGAERATGEMGAIQSYCSNMRDLAKDARYRRQFAELKEIAKEIDEKVKELRERTEEYKKWYELRRTFSEKATDSLVQIYSKMRAESAAAQISVMNQMTAAALLIKLDTRVASAVLNEIEPKKAASLSSLIAAAANKKTNGDPS